MTGAASKTIVVTVALSLLLCGCILPEPPSSVTSPSDTSNSDSLFSQNTALLNPYVIVGNLQAKHRVAYIWSHDCSRCSIQFEEVFPFYQEAVSKNDILFSFLEYETNQRTIDNYTVPGVCGGAGFFQWYTLGFFAQIYSISRIKTLNSNEGGTYQGCEHEELVQEYLVEYFAKMKEKFPTLETDHGLITVDGNIVKSEKELKAALAN